MKTSTYIFLLFVGFVPLSCGNWLDVLPKSEVDEEEMFETANGYYSALTGVYINMASSDLYGGNLSLTLSEPLTQQYTVSSNEPEREKWMNYDYTGKEAQDALLNVWSSMYNTIVNCNLLIEHLRTEERRLFEENVQSVLLGEALGLRAYMYFDLIRMFNESPTVNPDSKNVPYKTDFGLTLGISLPTDELLQHLLADLEEALQLLAGNDPIVNDKSYRDKYLNYDHNQRMNYYAIHGLMARIYLFQGNYSKAYEHARTVITSNKFRFITADEIVQTDRYGNEIQLDRLFVPELLFGLYTENILTVSRSRYEGLSYDFLKSTDCYNSEDLRVNAWHSRNQLDKINLIKYKRSSNAADDDKYQDPLVPLLKLSEMYLIATEAALQEPANGGDPVALLNTFKSARKVTQLSPTAGNDEISQEITHEYICEFRGEGQLFWYYKRMNFNAIDNGNYRGTTIEIAPAAYTFPLPQYEIDFGGGK